MATVHGMRRVLLVLLLAALVLPALALTLLRMLQPGGDLAVRAVSFTPLALPAYLVALLVVLVRAFVGRGSGSRVWTRHALVLALGAGVHAWWLSPQFLGDAPAAGSGAQPLTVMTLNLKEGEADPPRVVEAAADARADVLVLEEVTPAALRQLERYGLDQAFPYRAGEPAEDRAGTMVFSAHRVARPEQLPTELGAWAADVVTPEGVLRLYAVHVESPTLSSALWGKDLATLRRMAADDAELDLIVGDLNATPDHEPLLRLADDGWRSAAEVTNEGWAPTWPDNGARTVLGVVPVPRLVQIDHLLLAPSLTALDTTTHSIEGTDHRAVVATLALR